MLVAFAVLDGLYGVVGSWFCFVLLAGLHAVAGGSLWLFGFAAGCRSGFGHLASGLHIAMISGMPITASASWILAGVNFIDRRRRHGGSRCARGARADTRRLILHAPPRQNMQQVVDLTASGPNLYEFETGGGHYQPCDAQICAALTALALIFAPKMARPTMGW